MIGTIVLLFVKTETSKTDDESHRTHESIFDRMSHRTKHVLGTFLSIFAGLMYALTYEPQL